MKNYLISISLIFTFTSIGAETLLDKAKRKLEEMNKTNPQAVQPQAAQPQTSQSQGTQPKEQQTQAQQQQMQIQNTDSQAIRESNKVDPEIFKKFTFGNLEGPRWATAGNCKGSKPTLNVWVYRTTTSCNPPQWNVGNYSGGSCRTQSPFSIYATAKNPEDKRPTEFMTEINGIELVNLDGQEVVKISGESFTRGSKESDRFVNFIKFENANQYRVWADYSYTQNMWYVREGKVTDTGRPTEFRFNCESNSPELLVAKKEFLNNPEILKKKADLLFKLAVNWYNFGKVYDMSKPQWDFNVKYGAPPVSENFTKLVKKDFPEAYRILGVCSKKLGGQDINNETMEKYIQTSTDEDAVQIRKMYEFLSNMGAEEAPVRVPLKKDLNAAADNEVTFRSNFNQANKIFKFRNDKDWCEKLTDMDY